MRYLEKSWNDGQETNNWPYCSPSFEEVRLLIKLDWTYKQCSSFSEALGVNFQNIGHRCLCIVIEIDPFCTFQVIKNCIPNNSYRETLRSFSLDPKWRIQHLACQSRAIIGQKSLKFVFTVYCFKNPITLCQRMWKASQKHPLGVNFCVSICVISFRGLPTKKKKTICEGANSLMPVM